MSSLFAKKRNAKRIEFEGGLWVDVRTLSKGEKDAFETETMQLMKGVEYEDRDGKMVPKDGMFPPEVLQKLKDIEYRMITASITSWSEDAVEISVETVKELADDVFTKIDKEVATLNNLTPAERKN
ncbi:hypothetical protein [Effusibacillus consociatus]|uniref:Tail assembly chaperone n=1 Tax=Effusibacillus consociatus TaxID=1117041 RepID=A0ABV9Q4K1_9BACL